VLIAPIMVLFLSRMKKLFTTSLLISMLLIALLGCAGSGPSPEQRAREADEQREAERQQKEFRKTLPPVSNPGQGW
jgi:predicted small lipoprotein YifL